MNVNDMVSSMFMAICRTVSDFEKGTRVETIKRKEYVLMRNVLTKGPLTGICIGLSSLFYLDLSLFAGPSSL